MKQTKKALALLVAALLVASITACGNSAASSSASSSDTASVSSSETASVPSSSESSSEASSEESSEASSEESSSEAEAPAGEPLSEEEYSEQMKAAFASMQEAVATVQTMDTDNMSTDELKKALEPVKASLNAVGNLNAPEKYAAGQAKYKEGTDKMVEYFDYLLEISEMTDADLTPEKQQEMITKMTTFMTEAGTALNEGKALLDAAGLDFSNILPAAASSAPQA